MEKLNKNEGPPLLFFEVNIFMIFVQKNMYKVITFYLIYILIDKIIVLV